MLHGKLKGLIFFTGEKEIAGIGETTTDCATIIMIIDLARNEVWFEVSSSYDDGYMSHFKFITARLD